jgi:hypothetical protein
MWPHFVNLLCRAGLDLISTQGTTWKGFITPLVASFSSVGLTVFAILRFRGKEELAKHWQVNSLIALGVTILVNGVIYLSLFLWSCIRVVYLDHQQNTATINRLAYFGAHEAQYRLDLNEAQAKASHWRDAYTAISKGEIVPDRIMNREDTEKLHDKLEEYKKASKERKYSTVKIRPAFPDDQESSNLSFQLLKTFKSAHWDVKEGEHDKELTALFRASLPTGVVLFSDDPRNQAEWVKNMLKGVGIDTTISDRVPVGFKGTLICVGYKMFKQLSP